MLILRRKEGQWIEITHRSGDKIRVRVCNIRARYPGQLDMVLDDPDHHFVIQRAERVAKIGAVVPDAGEDAQDSPGILAETTSSAGGSPEFESIAATAMPGISDITVVSS